MSIDGFEESFELNDILSPRDVDKNNEYIINIILNFINFNKELDNIKRDKNGLCYEFYALNVEWMKNFLKCNEYEKILRCVSNGNKNTKQSEVLYIKKQAKQIITNSNSICKDNNNEYTPKKKEFMNVYNNNNIKYFSEFILVDEKFYDNLKEIKGISPSNQFLQNKVNIILLYDSFIYIINNNILGYGEIPILQKNESYYIFKVKFLLIYNEEYGYNCETELEALKTKSINEYLRLERNVILNIRTQTKILYDKEKTKEIGILYFVDENNYFCNINFIKKDLNKFNFNQINSNGNVNKLNHNTRNNKKFSLLDKSSTFLTKSTIFNCRYQNGPNFNFYFDEKNSIFFNKDKYKENEQKSPKKNYENENIKNEDTINEENNSFTSESVEISINNSKISQNIPNNLHNSYYHNNIESDNNYNNSLRKNSMSNLNSYVNYNINKSINNNNLLNNADDYNINNNSIIINNRENNFNESYKDRNNSIENNNINENSNKENNEDNSENSSESFYYIDESKTNNSINGYINIENNIYDNEQNKYKNINIIGNDNDSRISSESNKTYNMENFSQNQVFITSIEYRAIKSEGDKSENNNIIINNKINEKTIIKNNSFEENKFNENGINIINKKGNHNDKINNNDNKDYNEIYEEEFEQIEERENEMLQYKMNKHDIMEERRKKAYLKREKNQENNKEKIKKIKAKHRFYYQIFKLKKKNKNIFRNYVLNNNFMNNVVK